MPTGRPRILSKHETTKVITMYKSGASAVTIGREIKASHPFVLGVLKNAGVKRRSKKESAQTRPPQKQRKARITKQCLKCNKQFQVTKLSRRSKKKFCSSTCYNQRLNRVERECLFCHKKTLESPKSNRKFCSLRCYHAWSLSQSVPTIIETTVQQWLCDARIDFETQYEIVGFFADILVPHKCLVIECDGDYWHNLPSMLKRKSQRDAAIRRQGFHIIHLWEHEIKHKETTTRKRLLSLIKKLPNKKHIAESSKLIQHTKTHNFDKTL